MDNFLRIYKANKALLISLSKDEANDPVLANRIETDLTGIFIVGSNDLNAHVVKTLRPSAVDTLVLKAFMTILNNGGMVAGNCEFMVSIADFLQYLVY